MKNIKDIEEIRRENLISLIEQLGSVKKLAIKLDKHDTFISGVKKGKRRFTEDFARLIEKKLNLEHRILDLDKSETITTDDIVYIPEYNIKLSAGSGCEITDEDIFKQIPFLRSDVIRYGAKLTDLAIFTVDGESMFPTLLHQERILIDTSKKEVIDNKIFAICRDNRILIKRLFIHPVTRKVLVKSDNPNHKEFDFEATECDKIMGLAVNTLGRKLA